MGKKTKERAATAAKVGRGLKEISEGFDDATVKKAARTIQLAEEDLRGKAATAATPATEQPKEIPFDTVKAILSQGAAERAATAAEMERAEKMIDRLEGERIKADEALKEQAEHLGRVIGILKMMDDRGMLSLEKAGQVVHATKAAAAADTYGIESYFRDRANMEVLLAVRLWNDMMCVGKDSPTAQAVMSIIDHRLSVLKLGEIVSNGYGEDACYLAGAIAGITG